MSIFGRVECAEMGLFACAGVCDGELVDDGFAVGGCVLRGLCVLGLLGWDQHFDGYGHNYVACV